MGTRPKNKPPEPGRRLITRDQHMAVMERYDTTVVERLNTGLEDLGADLRRERSVLLAAESVRADRLKKWVHALAAGFVALLVSFAVLAFMVLA